MGRRPKLDKPVLPVKVVEGGKVEPKKPGGEYYLREQRLAIMERMNAGEPLAWILREDGMPCEKTVYGWFKTDAELANLYENGKPTRARALFEMALDKLHAITDRESAYVAKVQSDGFMKAAGLLDPKNFSDKTHGQMQKAGGTAPVSITLNIGQHGASRTIELTANPQLEDASQ